MLWIDKFLISSEVKRWKTSVGQSEKLFLTSWLKTIVYDTITASKYQDCVKKKKSDMYINISTILLRSDTTSFDSSCKVFKKKLQNHLKLYINLAQLTDLPGVNNMKFPSCTEEAWAE